jgi:hypothetical protein
MSSPYDDIEWLHYLHDLFARFAFYVDSCAKSDEIACIAWCISVRCPVEYARTVES